MEILQIVGFGLTAAVLIALIRSQAPQIALLLSLFAGAALFMLIVQRVGTVIGAMEHLAGAANIDWVFVQTIFKIVGIAYIAEFGAQIVRDAGESALAGKIELAGKVMIMVLAVPILTSVVETVMRVLQ
ncbi:stage III sporulation protein AD [Kyrpidia tusciae]|uniref:Stage III sporulation protein AD n=1 Tax=Kyrpidia tusciae (strain DSM 2912 / NBRC 15312 / T2) TaxID=562970 RepID=D5WV75_KYRT2|nr:stage III sporulation protein AD [Kyrpidia tusciae]ADG05485.1 stage III sporulation protein AD [Kyrpidia tusciae DSM 2912]MBE3551616.1 stage III sporulation protein AD [Kyrpidia tusciae]